MLAHARILNLLDTIGNLANNLEAVTLGIGAMLALGGEEGSFAIFAGAAGEEGCRVFFLAHFDPFVEHCLGFFFGASHGWTSICCGD
jgi:hypothetical protein